MKTNLEPKPDASLEPLTTIFWDYNYPLSGQDLFDFAIDKKDIPYLDRNQVRARMLMSVGWYRLIDIFGLINLQYLLTEEVLKWVWVDDLRKQYAMAKDVISRIKCDFIATRKGSHIGDYKKSPVYSRIDNPRNILAEKLSFIYQNSPKNIADIWTICGHLSFNWEEVIGQANQKRTTDPLLAAETLRAFPAADLEKVRWIKPIRVEHFERDRDIMVQNIVTKDDNHLVKKKSV